MNSSQRLLGLLARKERWGLSWRGWLVLVVLLALAAWGLVRGLYPFLAVTQRVPARVLVVEGWVPDPVIAAAILEFRSGKYDRVISTGGPLRWSGGHASSQFDTTAHWGAARLGQGGIPADKIESVPALSVVRDRTYSSALALRDWFQAHALFPDRVNVVTEDVHARRSRLLFQEALGDGVKVGIIAVPNPDYDTKHWWWYSEGVRDVIGETLAYLYARFLFWPTDGHAK